MPEWKCVAGGTLLIPTGNENHLFIILNDPADFNGYLPNSCISVNVTSMQANTHNDDTCVLAEGSHPFIKHESYVVYRYARLETAAKYEKMVQDCYCSPHDPIEAVLLDQIQEGLKTSPFTPRFIKQLI